MRACDRARRRTRLELERGLGGLVFVCRIAPWLGIALTALEIIGSFRGVIGDKWAFPAGVFENLSEALPPIELGLAIGIGALVAHRWLFARCENLEREMRNATLELANELSRLA